jgi:hypothetical protein
VVYIVGLALAIWSTRTVMVAVANVGNVPLRGIINNVTFTNVVLNRKVLALVLNAKNFPVQDLYDSAITLFGCIICQS